MSISILLLLINKINYKYYLRIFCAFLFFILISITALQIKKSPTPAFEDTQTPSWITVVKMISHKIIWRQVDTGYCFQTVIEEHSSDKFDWSKQMFWARALIPRIVWPEKENLSLGSSYSVAYCDTKRKNAHSASITLLGQPFIMGGVRGFLLHGAFLFIGLSGLTYVSRRYPGVGRVFVVALLPWWIDFDQDFALYVANLVKFFLLMCLIAVPLSAFGQSSEYEPNAA